MTTIAHLSDIHFGAHDPQIVAATTNWLIEHTPDIVIISGDLTQRARRRQFIQAADFIGKIRAAKIEVLTVPGNHDVPLYDVTRRFLSPLGRYKRFISRNTCPWFENDTIAVLGINTARSMTIKGGRISHEQMHIIEERFRTVADTKCRILVTHHPLFTLPIGESKKRNAPVGRHTQAIKFVRKAGVHLALAGHLHLPFASTADALVENFGSLLVVQAGTATSTRLRGGEVQSFNWLRLNGADDLTLQVMQWQDPGFRCAAATRYRLASNSWRIVTNSFPEQLTTGIPK